MARCKGPGGSTIAVTLQLFVVGVYGGPRRLHVVEQVLLLPVFINDAEHDVHIRAAQMLRNGVALELERRYGAPSTASRRAASRSIRSSMA